MNQQTRPRFPAVRPELPPMSAWTPILEEAYQANWFTNFGALSRRLEAELASRWGRANNCCVTASSGTAALAAPLIAQQVRGKVLLPAFTFPATAWAIKIAGAEPLLVDVNGEDWRISPAAFDEALSATNASAAIVVVPFGLQSDLSPHIEIAAERGVCLVIDNAAGLGAGGARTSLPANVFEVFSLHATKPFGIGEGGAIIAALEHEDALRRALNFGLPFLGETGRDTWGMNGKLSELHAAVGLAVAADFERRLSLRRAMAKRYIHLLAGFPEIAYPTDERAAPWQLFPMLLPSAEDVEAFTAVAMESGLETRRYYRPALSQLASLNKFSACTVSEDLSDRMVCVPVYAADRQECDEVVALVSSALQKVAR